MNIVTINGSAREHNYTGKALGVVHAELEKLPNVTVTKIEPARMQLAVPGLRGNRTDAEDLQAQVGEADGVVLATPEYHGSFSSLVKLTLENMGFPSALKGKTIALLGVASGRIGAVKSLEHLRSVCSHIGALVVPRAISVARVRQVFDLEGRCLDPAVEQDLQRLAVDLVKLIHQMRCPELSFEEWARMNETAA